jgi:large subunit ribosomal protein L25
MSKIVQLKATSRGRAGKGASRATRREGLVPGVIYGEKQEAQIISLKYRDLEPHVHTGRFMSTLVDLDVEGKTVRAIARDVQFEPVRDFIIHVDFLRLGKGSRISVDIPVHFKGQEVAPGIKAGGTLNIISHTLALYCSSDFIPDELSIDVSGLQIGQSIHVSDIKLPEGTSSVSREDLTLCTVSAQAKEEVATEAPVASEVPATAQKAPDAAAAAAPAAGAKGAAAPAKGAAPAAAAPAAKKK